LKETFQDLHLILALLVSVLGLVIVIRVRWSRTAPPPDRCGGDRPS
jgi:hypothetical protein